jgi:hypothetical protein
LAKTDSGATAAMALTGIDVVQRQNVAHRGVPVVPALFRPVNVIAFARHFRS